MTPAPNLLRIATGLADSLGPGDLDVTLDRITAAAVELVPEVTYASITVRHDDRLETVGATDDSLTALDAKQYALREGPCYEAATDSVHVVASDLANDTRFSSYGPVAAEAGILAQTAFRLFERNSGQGALNLYSDTRGAFADLDEVAALFQSQAGMAIAYAWEVTSLTEAVHTRTVIGQAMGIVMERYKLTDERAFAFLTRLSQHRNIKLRRVAEELVAELAVTVEAAEGATESATESAEPDDEAG